MRQTLVRVCLCCVTGCGLPAAMGQPPIPFVPPPVAVRAPAPPAADDFYLPLPPRFVAGPMVEEAAWSPDGRYVSAIANDIGLPSLPGEGADPPTTQSLVIWNVSTQRSTTVWSDTGGSARITGVAWLPGTSVVFLSADWEDAAGSAESGLWRVDARRSGATKLDGFNPDDMLYVSPTQPFACVFGSYGGTAYLKPLAANGSIGAPLPSVFPMAIPAGWTQDGRSLVLPPLHPAPEGSGGDVTKLKWQVYDARSGRITAVDKPPTAYAPPARTYSFRVRLEPVRLTGASAIKVPWSDSEVNQAWLEQGEKASVERLLIAANAQRVDVSPRGDSLLYVNNEGAFVVGLLRMPKATMEKARSTAQRTQLLNNGKQIALGIHMWSQDHDEDLPSSGEDMKSLLGPYIKSDAVFEGVGGDNNTFVYSLNGGSMASIKDPANTMMGYIPGPGGFAVVYADGHVEWKTELPPPSPPE